MLRGNTSTLQRPIPQPKLRPIVGNLPDVGTTAPIQALMRLAGELGPIFRLTFPSQEVVFVSSHALVDELSDESRFDKFLHGSLRQLRDLGGDGLFTAETHEPNWGLAHRILMPAFGPLAMRNYFAAMLDIADQMLTKWERLGDDVDIDVTDNMTRLTLDTIALCGFSYRFNSFYQREMHPFVEAMVRALAEAGARAKRVRLQTRLMLLTQRQYENDRELMHSLVTELVAERRRMPQESAPRDLLGLMLSGKDAQTGEQLDDANIRNQMVTFLIAGHETTSGLLSFTLYQLLKHPEVLARLRHEVDTVLGDATPRFEQLAELTYLDQVLRESLRIWPTAPAYGVHPKTDTLLADSYPVKRGEAIVILTPMLHRDREVWGDDPERFDPDRFAPHLRERIPPNAWKPFGNGQRACIGRPFAMQESMLALAMLLQRFDISLSGDYELSIKETLTLKPQGLMMRKKLRKPIARSISTSAAVTVSAPPTITAAPAPAAHGTPLVVLYGSNSGSAEAFARRIAGDAIARGYATEVAAMDERVDKLPRAGGVVIVTASYNGAPPDNARRFCDWLTQLPSNALSGIRYTVFGCGNRDWSATYQAVPKRVDEAMAAAGATRLMPRGEADARADFFGDFESWYAPACPALDAAFAVQSESTATTGLYQIERVDAAVEPLLRQHGVQLATMLENRELCDLSAPFARSKRHLELELPPGLSYNAGDYLVVLPENDPELVERAARRFGLAGDTIVKLHASRAGAASLPTDQPITVRELLSRYVELATPATRKQVEELATFAQCPKEKLRLATLANDNDAYRATILGKRVSVLDLLDENLSCNLPFARFLEWLPPLRPRQYSISSSPLWNASRCTLTVAVVDAPALSGHGRYRGAASSHLARRVPGDRVAVTVRAPNTPFRPTEPATPMIMIAAGTGLAPFRGFIQERALRQNVAAPVAESLLFFGCDHPDVDFLYRQELAEWQAQGVVALYPAFFRAADGDVTFVQHRLWQERARVRELLDRGAHIFVCGDGVRMAPAVRETLARIHQEAAGATDAEATSWLASLEREGRYVADVFG
jgi:cytochrome P450/NADPH-cytochrome P450 reductase